jgi:hypothetical protein
VVLDDGLCEIAFAADRHPLLIIRLITTTRMLATARRVTAEMATGENTTPAVFAELFIDNLVCLPVFINSLLIRSAREGSLFRSIRGSRVNRLIDRV